MEEFYKKNDIGVSIKYTVVGRYDDEGKKYIIYTDFVADPKSLSGIRLFVSRDDGEIKRIEKAEEERIIQEMYKEISDSGIKMLQEEEEL